MSTRGKFKPALTLSEDDWLRNSMELMAACRQMARSADWSASDIEDFTRTAMSGDRADLEKLIRAEFETGDA